MKMKVMEHTEARIFVVVFEIGDEVPADIAEFARAQGITAAHFSGIGACERATLAYWDWDSKSYLRMVVAEQIEVVSLLGNIAVRSDDQVKVHAHVILGKRDGSVQGGHLVQAHVRPTLELIIHEMPRSLRRSRDAVSGLDLLVP